MFVKLITNDIRKSKLMTTVLFVFVLLASLCTALAATLGVSLFGSIDQMMERAQTPHFLQMHSGVIQRQRLNDFVSANDAVEKFQLIEFLNIDGADIQIAGHTLADSIQDNGLVVQSEGFDFLLDLDNRIAQPQAGEIYLPLVYLKEKMAVPGDRVVIGDKTFLLTGFIRDSQMNSSLSSSKRFLLHPDDFAALRTQGRMEYLIEFRLKPDASLTEFEAAYAAAGLESNGPLVTYPMFRMVNALADGLLIAVLILLAVLVVLVTFLCIRFTLLTKVEEDRREIGVLKAIGLRQRAIRRVYAAKYAALAGAACLSGYVLSWLLAPFMLVDIRLFMGGSEDFLTNKLIGILAAALIFFIILLFVFRVLKRFKKLSAAQVLRSGSSESKSLSRGRMRLSRNRLLPVNAWLGVQDVLTRAPSYLTLLLILIIAVFIIIVPRSMHYTMSKADFVTYMGIGSCDLRVDIQQTEDNLGLSRTLAKQMAQDADIRSFAVLTSRVYELPTDAGDILRLKVELGDHRLFPVAYLQGVVPSRASDIALSALNAEVLGKNIGDSLTLMVNDVPRTLTVCGIYSDITNGGKTAKACFTDESDQILWVNISVALNDPALSTQKVEHYKRAFPAAKISSIGDYLKQLYGQAIAAVATAAGAATLLAVLLSLLITLLFMRMLMVRDRSVLATLKTQGFANRDLLKQYLTRALVISFSAVTAGLLLSVTLGARLGSALVASFGAPNLHFDSDPLFAFIIAPGLVLLSVFMATVLASREINSLNPAQHLKE